MMHIVYEIILSVKIIYSEVMAALSMLFNIQDITVNAKENL